MGKENRLCLKGGPRVQDLYLELNGTKLEGVQGLTLSVSDTAIVYLDLRVVPEEVNVSLDLDDIATVNVKQLWDGGVVDLGVVVLAKEQMEQR